MDTPQPLAQLEQLQSALQALAQSEMRAADFSALASQQTALLAALPPRFDEVLTGLLVRLESSALFTDDSCSFSHRDLVESLQMWLDKARPRLSAAS